MTRTSRVYVRDGVRYWETDVDITLQAIKSESGLVIDLESVPGGLGPNDILAMNCAPPGPSDAR